DVELIDVNAKRAAVAVALGARFAVAETAAADADVVLHASGTSEGLALSLRLAGFEATVVELSWYGDRGVALPLGEAVHSRRLTLKSAQVGTVDARRRARWTTSRRLQLALSLLADPALDVLISGESDFDDLPAVMAGLATSPGDSLCHRIRY